MNAHQRRLKRRRFDRHYPFVAFAAGVNVAIVRAFAMPAHLLSGGPRLGDSWATETDRLRTPACAVTGN